MEQDKMVISIKDMMYVILKQWRKLLIWMVIFCVLADAFAAYKSYKAVKAAETSVELVEEDAQTKVENAMVGLSQREIDETKEAANNYFEYFKAYKERKQYYDNSLLMQLDTNHVQQTVLQFEINNSDSGQARDIALALYNTIPNDELCQQIAADLDIEAEYVRELLTTYVGDYAQIRSLGTTALSGNNSEVDVEAIALTFVYNLADNETVDEVADAIRTNVLNSAEALKTVYGAFEIHEVAFASVNTMEYNVASSQQNAMNNLYSLRNNMTNCKNNLTEQEKVLYYALIDASNLENQEDGNAVEDSSTENVEIVSAPKPEMKYINKKYMVLGLAGGLVLGMGWFALIYLLGTALRNKDDIKEVYSFDVIGRTIDVTDKKTKGLDGIIEKLLGDKESGTKEKELPFAATELAVLLDKHKAGKVLISSTNGRAASTDICQLLKDKLVKENEHVFVVDSLLSDAATLEEMKELDAIILVEQIGVSEYKDLDRVKMLCDRYQVPVLGCVVIR